MVVRGFGDEAGVSLADIYTLGRRQANDLRPLHDSIPDLASSARSESHIFSHRNTRQRLLTMAESPAASTGALPGESPAQTKARLRRERLAAKSGASRLQQITALQGGPPKDISEFEKDVPGT